MRFLIVILGMFSALAATAEETRCGWLENPSPANMWLIDRDGSWDISVQGTSMHWTINRWNYFIKRLQMKMNLLEQIEAMVLVVLV